MVSEDKHAVEVQESRLISTDPDPRSSPASAIGQRPSRGTRGSRRSQLQALAAPLAKSKLDDGTEEDQKEAEGEESKANVSGAKAASSKAKKRRRSGRRR